MSAQEKNFWLTTVEEPQIPARDLPESVDVAVIGGGFTGLSAARTLAKGGAQVAVLEAENVGWGASCRNGGMVLSGLKLGTATLIARYGREATKRMYAASLESIDCVEAVVSEENINCDFSRCGHLEVACKAKHFEDFGNAFVSCLLRHVGQTVGNIGLDSQMWKQRQALKNVCDLPALRRYAQSLFRIEDHVALDCNVACVRWRESGDAVE